MDVITGFFGRFHPLIVHLPIGILFLSFLFECLSFHKSYKGLRKAVQPALFWGMIFTVAAAITGFFLRQEGGYDESIADRHQNFGLTTAVLCLIVFVLRPKVKYWVDTPRAKKLVKLALSVPLIIALIITGHFGGSLTHGEDYLFAALRMTSGEEKDPTEKIRTIADVDEAVMYDAVIQPILEARCYDCHSSSKQKGDLRLDSEDFIRRGGKDGAVLSDGPADSSSLYKRLILPLEHEDHMPPNEKPQLSSSEIALIQYWIEDHADFKKQVRSFKSEDKIAAIIKTLQQPAQQTWVPSNSVGEATTKARELLAQSGISAMPIAQENNYLMVSFAGQPNITDQQLSVLKEIEEQLVWLNLGHTAITDEQMDAVAQLRNLRVLYLNNTSITDAGIVKLGPLSELRWLSLVGTGVSDASVETIAKLPKLNTLFLFETNVSDEAITRLRADKQEIVIDTGNYKLEKLATDTVVYKKVKLGD